LEVLPLAIRRLREFAICVRGRSAINAGGCFSRKIAGKMAGIVSASLLPAFGDEAKHK
jgi:hypothetical protein